MIEFLKKYKLDDIKHANTPVALNIKLDLDPSGKSVLEKIYRGIKGVGLWYPRDGEFNLIGYSDANYANYKGDRKSTSGHCHFLEHFAVSWHPKK